VYVINGTMMRGQQNVKFIKTVLWDNHKLSTCLSSNLDQITSNSATIIVVLRSTEVVSIIAYRLEILGLHLGTVL
jgi:hypothetical protein